MKICILSMQKVPNFGSLLQSYALKKILEDLGHDVSFIDIQKNNSDNIILKNEIKIVKFSHKKYDIIFFKFSRFDKYFFNRIKNKLKDRKQNNLFHNFRTNFLDMQQSNNTNKYNVCVIGSDEVFNCLTPSKWGFTSQLFGNVKQAERVITYAASCGSTNFALLPIPIREKIRETFYNISAFSVRDKNTENFVYSIAKRDAEMHFDPVAIMDYKNEITKVKLSISLPNCYCLIYSYYNRIHKDEEILAIKKICKNKGMELVSIGGPQTWVKKHLVLTPFEVLAVFSKAEFVITDTFHGTIFASKYSNRFAVIVRKSNKNKLEDLVQKLSINAHLLNKINQINDVYKIIHKKDELNKVLFKEYKKTVGYFNRNI